MIIASFIRRFAVMAAALISLTIASVAQQWEITANLQQGRHWHQAAVLADGRILIIGGITGSSAFLDGMSMDGLSTASCEIFNPITGEVTQAASMNSPRSEFPVVTAPNGDIYVLGGLSGESQRGTCTDLIERYDANNDRWEIVGRMTSSRRRHAAVQLDNHRILICGGAREDRITYGDSEVFDLQTGQTTATDRMPANMKEGEMAMLDGLLPVYIGGRQGGPNSPRQEELFVFDVENNTWYTREQPVGMPAIVSGTVVGPSLVICGGNISEAPYEFSRGVYAVEDGFVRHVVDLDKGRSLHAMTPLGERTVLVSGGSSEDYGTLASSFAIDVEGAQILIKPDHVISRGYHKLLRYAHPTLGLTFYAISGMTNVRTVARDTIPMRGGDDGHNNPSLTPTIEMLTVYSEALLLQTSSTSSEFAPSTSVYPNPVVSELSIAAPAGSFVSITDVMGRTVASTHVSDATALMDLQNLTAGAYVVVIRSGNHTVTHTIIKR
jgi:Secretion system C-terminal sorting domain/Kelch motif/Galactose oxidase, central domain